MAVFFSLCASPIAYADALDDQIRALKAQASAQQSEASALHTQANTYQQRVNQLNSQARYLQTQISINQLKHTKVSSDIDQAKANMASQKAVLSENIKTIYLNSATTPLEMIASSSNLSEYFDQQQYHDKVKSKIESALARIQALKKDLEKQQADLTILLANLDNQRTQLTAMQTEANQLLAAAARSAADADSQVRASNAEITKLKAQQAAILAARFGSATGGAACGGGYPGKWCNVPQDSTVDNWGMYNRECVSYAAFKVAVSGRGMPYWGGRGNAKQWPGNATAAGIPVNSTPREGDVAISMAGPYGHAMYVESVLPDGRIHVSQYNYGNHGEYSEMVIPSGSLNFIHF